jgi:erythronate-4-phosphate dehydrogenase
MFDQDFFTALKPGALFINTARGEAVDEAALLKRLDAMPLHLVLDVWQNEPHVDPLLVQQTLISTPHIAGYAYDGKLRGTEMVYQAACRFFGVQPQWSMQAELNEGNTSLSLGSAPNFIFALQQLVQQVYDITQDSDQLRKMLKMQDTQAAVHFDELRKNYPKRREFSHFDVNVSQLSLRQRQIIQQLGFNTCL